MVSRYLLKRLGQALLVLCLSITITFILYRVMPGSPIEVMRARLIQNALEGGGQIPQAELQRINNQIEVMTAIRPDKPLYVQYFDYMKNIILYQNFGNSITYGDDVFQILFTRMPWSIFISVYGLALGVSVSLLLGAAMAHTDGSRFDVIGSLVTTVTMSIPYYIIAIVLIIIFALELQWFPTNGRYDNSLTPGFNLPFMKSVVHHGTLPIVTSFIAGFGGALAFRGNCIREKGKEYIKVARLRGISESRLAIRYIGRNSLLPIYTGLMLNLSALFGSAIILEIMFNYKAMGLITFRALESRDYPLLMGAFIFFTAITVTGIFIADMTYGIIDPRVKGGDERETY